MRPIKLMVLVVIASFAAPSARADHRANSVAGALIGGEIGATLLLHSGARISDETG